ncbi:MAG: RIP metalloprotease RseP [Eubacteriaceae bacterium]|nr:RIP metalloprotease RseP [Eubacteriaceae bacterium]
MTAVYAIILFVLLIFPHELGHFIVAKAAGVKVNEFAFGMGPALFKKQKGETTYSIRLVPIGGFCAMEGEDENSDDDRAFNNKPAWAKISILVAGAAMNVLIAFLVMTIMMCVYGQVDSTMVDQVQEGMPAYEAGMIPGDKIVQIDETEIDNWNRISEAIGSDEKRHNIIVERDGQRMELKMTPVLSDDGTERYVIGITPVVTHNVFKSIVNGAKATWGLGRLMVESLRMLVTREASVNDITGPVGIISMAGETATYGLTYFGNLLALMSLNLAFINLLPLPALDGGRILFVIIRKIAGGRISDQAEAAIHSLGMILLIVLMIFITFNDFERFL